MCPVFDLEDFHRGAYTTLLRGRIRQKAVNNMMDPPRLNTKPASTDLAVYWALPLVLLVFYFVILVLILVFHTLSLTIGKILVEMSKNL